MKLFFAAAAIALILSSGLAAARPLADFSSGSMHIRLGKSAIAKAYINNPNSTFANITVWLGGDYPADLAKFSAEDGLFLSADRRNLTVGLNPNEERAVSLSVLSTGPKDGGYMITMSANTTADSSLEDYGAMMVFVDYSPDFPALEPWGIAAIIAVSCFGYWRLRHI